MHRDIQKGHADLCRYAKGCEQVGVSISREEGGGEDYPPAEEQTDHKPGLALAVHDK